MDRLDEGQAADDRDGPAAAPRREVDGARERGDRRCRERRRWSRAAGHGHPQQERIASARKIARAFPVVERVAQPTERARQERLRGVGGEGVREAAAREGERPDAADAGGDAVRNALPVCDRRGQQVELSERVLGPRRPERGSCVERGQQRADRQGGARRTRRRSERERGAEQDCPEQRDREARPGADTVAAPSYAIQKIAAATAAVTIIGLLVSRGLRRAVCACLACVGLLTAAGVALAKDPGGISAADQSRETIPTSGGRVATGAPAPARPLPAPQRRQIDLEGGSDAPILKQVVSSPAYGAPLATSFYQSGLYFRNWQPKRTLHAFRFPFVAFAESGKVFVWGRTPAGKLGSVVIEQSASGAWRKLGSLPTDRYGIFSQLYATPGVGPLRARLLDAGDVSVPFSLQVPPDHFYYPFGS